MIEIPGILEDAASRRQFLQCSAYGALASALNQSRLQSAEPARANRIQSCIMLMLYGGPSHLDTWDMKPAAASEIRGEYRPIQSNVPGRIVCEHLTACSRMMDKMAVIQSMHHGLTNHNSAMYQAMIGRPASSNNEILGASRQQDFPNFGATLSYMTATGALPRTRNPLVNVALPHVMHNVTDLPGQNAGFLGGSHDPMQITDNPNQPDFRVRNLRLPAGVNESRMQARRTLQLSLDQGIGSDAENIEIDAYQKRAFELLHSDGVKTAFGIEREPEPMRNRYGRHKLGQSLLLARRLVESGVRFINVHDGIYNGQIANWDSHSNIFPRHSELLAPLDQGLSALIDDLDQRGLLESTLVIVTGEFGRSPRVNANAGRDHWPNCYSMLLAGGGVKGGAVFGSSDRNGAYPKSSPVTPGDLAATVFWRFGLDHEHEIVDPLARPFPIADGQPVRTLFPGVA